MTVITETRPSAQHPEAEAAAANSETARPVDVHPDLAWLLAQAWISTPLFA